MTYYETWRERNGHIETVVTDAPGGMRLVDAEDYDRLRKTLKDISIEGRHARSGGTAYRMAVIARAALQGAGD